jgi:hypothetical protein
MWLLTNGFSVPRDCLKPCGFGPRGQNQPRGLEAMWLDFATWLLPCAKNCQVNFFKNKKSLNTIFFFNFPNILLQYLKYLQ